MKSYETFSELLLLCIRTGAVDVFQKTIITVMISQLFPMATA